MPPHVVHGFRNAGDADMRYLNFHAPGCRFADYMRSIRDGDPLAYDQHDPPADGGRPIEEAHVAAGEEIADGVTLLADLAVLRVTRERGATEPRRLHELASYFALEGDLVLTARRRGGLCPGRVLGAGPARPRARGRRAVPVRHGAVVDNVNVSVRA